MSCFDLDDLSIRYNIENDLFDMEIEIEYEKQVQFDILTLFYNFINEYQLLVQPVINKQFENIVKKMCIDKTPSELSYLLTFHFECKLAISAKFADEILNMYNYEQAYTDVVCLHVIDIWNLNLSNKVIIEHPYYPENEYDCYYIWESVFCFE